MREALSAIDSMIFGLMAFHLCRYLLWLAPRTVVVANAGIYFGEDTEVIIPKRALGSRVILVRCYIDARNSTED